VNWIWKFISRLFGREQDMPLHGKIALPLVLVGAALIHPGWMDGLLSYLNKTFNLGLSLDTPWWVGGLVIVLGLIVYFAGEQRDRAGKGRFVAIRHQSFQPLTGPVTKDSLPRKQRDREIVTLECDQSNFLSGGAFDPIGAVRQQQRLAHDIATVRKTDPTAGLGYYGIVHIPLQFLAGFSVSTFPEVSLFELHRETSTWRELLTSFGPDLDVRLNRVADPPSPIACVVLISVSYAIDAADPSEVVPGPYREYSLSIGKPGIDRVTHYSQIEKLCSNFRTILDEVHEQLPRNLIVHVFYAGPVSVGFSLGRRISRTIHNPVIVYNYTARTTPAYAWGVEVTKDGEPKDMVVITT
jgi:hypothetical protein